MARRAYPRNLEIEETNEEVVVRCSHDGYRRLAGKPVHWRERRVGKHEFVIMDEISDSFSMAVSRFHFHPDVRVQCTGTNEGRAVFSDDKGIKWFVEGGTSAVFSSTYHPEFGISLPNQCLEVLK